jgi:excisionase family DNA binding protein
MSANDAKWRRLVSTQEAAIWLGVTPSTLRRNAADGTVPAFRVGKKLFKFDLTELTGQRPMTHPMSPVRSERGH